MGSLQVLPDSALLYWQNADGHALYTLAPLLTCNVRLTVVVQASSGNRLAAKQGIAVKVMAEFFQEAEDIGDTADSGQSQGVLLLVKVGWTGQRTG